MLKKWKSHEQVFDEEYKEIFVNQEISMIENFILLFYAKQGEDKTDFEVHEKKILFNRCKLNVLVCKLGVV